MLGLLAALAMAVPAQAARTVPVQVDGTALEAVCHLENGVTYVPLRALLNALGGWEVSWDSGQRAVTVDGDTRPGRVYVQEGVTYVPLRTIAELLGGTAEWDRYFQGAAVTSPDAAYNAVDFYWLSRIISAESRGEPMEGQIRTTSRMWSFSRPTASCSLSPWKTALCTWTPPTSPWRPPDGR